MRVEVRRLTNITRIALTLCLRTKLIINVWSIVLLEEAGAVS